MTDTTTIEIRTDQAKQLRELQLQNGNYKTVIDRLFETWESESELINYTLLADGISEQLVKEMAAQR